MSDGKQLIEEARLAFVEAWEEEDARTTFNSAARSEHNRSRAGIRAALAVFEKARTPTDDEREVWARVVAKINRVPDSDAVTVDKEDAKVLVAAGFRRTEGPEPRAAQVIAAVRAYADDRFRYGRQNRTVGSMRIAADLYAILGLPTKDLPTEDPQGEPSDARPYSEATDIEYSAWETDDIEEHAQDMLAVVRYRRAAVTDQGENHG